MRVTFYMDVHVHSGITEGLRSRGVEVLTAQEDGGAELEDPALLSRSTALGRILFTQDQDFLREGAERQRSGEPFGGLIYAVQSSALIGAYIRDLELMALASEAEEYRDQVVRLPL